jgi:hypothetical protein
MADGQSSLVLEQMQYIRLKVDSIDERVGRMELRLTAVDGHLGDLLLAEYGQSSETDKIRQQLDRIERRLGPVAS